MKVDRRRFLHNFASAAAFTLISGPAVFGGQSAPKEGNDMEPAFRTYYRTHRSELERSFKGMAGRVQAHLTAQYGVAFAEEVGREAEGIFDELYGQLPDLGGEKNPILENFMAAPTFLAFYRPMKKRGKAAEETARILYSVYEGWFAKATPELMQSGEEMFSGQGRRLFLDYAAWTQKKEHPSNFVASYVAGDGREFDLGYDFSECALVKYLTVNGGTEIAPYICLTDFLMSRAMRTGLSRTKTIAQGDGVCNFRFKKGREVLQNWGTEVPKFRKGKKGLPSEKGG